MSFSNTILLIILILVVFLIYCDWHINKDKDK